MQVETAETGRDTREISTGKIISIAYSPKMINNVGKEPKTSAEVTMFGIEGDRHFGETRYSPRQHMRVPNLRPITVMAVEGVREACDSLGDTGRYGSVRRNGREHTDGRAGRPGRRCARAICLRCWTSMASRR